MTRLEPPRSRLRQTSEARSSRTRQSGRCATCSSYRARRSRMRTDQRGGLLERRTRVELQPHGTHAPVAGIADRRPAEPPFHVERRIGRVRVFWSRLSPNILDLGPGVVEDGAPRVDGFWMMHG